MMLKTLLCYLLISCGVDEESDTNLIIILLWVGDLCFYEYNILQSLSEETNLEFF